MGLQEHTHTLQTHKFSRFMDLLYKTIVEDSLAGYFDWDLRSNAIYMTPAFKAMMGYQDYEVENSLDAWKNLIHPDDKEGVNLAFKEHVESRGEIKFTVEGRYRHKNGSYIYLLTLGKVVEWGIDGQPLRAVGCHVDITKQKVAEAKSYEAELSIRHSREQLRNFIRYCPVAVAMLDHCMNYIEASNLWISLYGAPDRDVSGKNHYELFNWIPQRWKEAHRRGLNGEVVKCDEDEFLMDSDNKEWIRYEIRPWYNESDQIGGIIIFTEIITDYVNTREALIRAREEAENAARMESLFLSTMSHEIRTPLNAVIGFTHLLLKDPRPDQTESLNILKFSAEHLLVLINDILDFNKIEAGKLEFENVDFSIAGLISNIKAAFQEKAAEKAIGLKLLLDDDLPPMVKGDPVRLGQVLNNLISNAVKFTNQGKVTIAAHLISRNTTDTVVEIEIRDTGIGIRPDKQEKIFESFSQASVDITRNYGGTGLGLAITKRLLQLMGSQIYLESEEGKGARFYFTLRLDSSDKHPFDEKPLTEQVEFKSFKGVKVLIAEDNKINVLVARQFLKHWDVECDVVENGLQALNMVQQHHYSVILMDLQMPVMDGYEATKKIRELTDEKYQKLPIIALTASVMVDHRDKAFFVGFNDYVGKPFTPRELYSKISKYVNPVD